MSFTTAKVIADTQHPLVPAARITTFEVYAPRFLLAEINTHRVIAKSAASSRAIPVMKRVEMLRIEPYIPGSFGKNKPGMQAAETLADEDDAKARAIWQELIDGAAKGAAALAALNTHKQHANRPMETYVHVKAVLTATEWDNYFALRDHSAAQPEFRELAGLMRAALAASTPTVGSLHLPYTDDLASDTPRKTFALVSAARCARVSYKTFDGRATAAEEDMKLCEDLLAQGHMSPFDHQAVADDTRAYMGTHRWCFPESHRQFWGWIPKRVEIESERNMPGRRSSFAPIPA